MTQLMGPKYAASSEASDLARKYNLGAPVYEYKESIAQTGCATVFLLVVGIFCLLAGFSSSSHSSDGSTTGTTLIIGFAALVLGIIMFFVSVTRSGNRLFACTEGFVYQQSNGDKVVHWSNVKAIYQRIVEHHRRVSRYTTYTYTIEQYDGSRLTFNDNMTPMEGLCSYIEMSMAAQLMPKAIAAYETGQTVDFGTLAVSKQGIFNGKEWLSWNDVHGVNFRNGRISIKKIGKWLNWASFFTPSIPNFTVLELLIQHIGQTRGW